MSNIVYGIWIGGQDSPCWWMDKTDTPFHSVHRGVVAARLAAKEGDTEHSFPSTTVEVIGPDGLPMSEDMQAWLAKNGGTYAAQYAAFTQAGSKE